MLTIPTSVTLVFRDSGMPPIKFEKNLTPTQLAKFLDRLGDALASVGGSSEPMGRDPETADLLRQADELIAHYGGG